MKRNDIISFCNEVKSGRKSSEEFIIFLEGLSPQTLLENMDILIQVSEVSSGMFINYTNMNGAKMSHKELEYTVNLLGNEVMKYWKGSPEEKIYNDIKKVTESLSMELASRDGSIRDFFAQEIIESTTMESAFINILNSVKIHPLVEDKSYARVGKLVESYINKFEIPDMMLVNLLPAAGDMLLCKKDPEPFNKIIESFQNYILENQDDSNMVAYRGLLKAERDRHVFNDRLDMVIEMCTMLIEANNTYMGIVESINHGRILDNHERINYHLMVETLHSITLDEMTPVQENITIKEFTSMMNNLTLINEASTPVKTVNLTQKTNNKKPQNITKNANSFGSTNSNSKGSTPGITTKSAAKPTPTKVKTHNTPNQSEGEDQEGQSEDTKKETSKGNAFKRTIDAALYPLRQLAKLDEKARRDKLTNDKTLVPKMMKLLKRITRSALGYLVVGSAGAIIAFLVGAARDKKVDEKTRRQIAREIEEEYAIVAEQRKDAEREGDNKKKYELMRMESKLKAAYAKVRFNVE